MLKDEKKTDVIAKFTLTMSPVALQGRLRPGIQIGHPMCLSLGLLSVLLGERQALLRRLVSDPLSVSPCCVAHLHLSSRVHSDGPLRIFLREGGEA